MQKRVLSITLLTAVLLWQEAISATHAVDEKQEQHEQRTHQSLENHLQDQNPIAPPSSPNSNDVNLIEISGLVEIEAESIDPRSGNSYSNLTLTTAELGIKAQISSAVSGEIALLYEEDSEESLDVDVATLTLSPEASWFFNAGQFYLPFGVFETQMTSDPLTLQLAETRETALEIGFTKGMLFGSIYIFDGEISNEETSKIDNFGIHLDLILDRDNRHFDISLGYINDIRSSHGLIEYKGENQNQVGGITLRASLYSGPFTLIGEYVSANDMFETGDKPYAYNLEVGYGFSLSGIDANVAIGFQATGDAEQIELPKEIMLAAFSFEMFEHTTLGIEITSSKTYDNQYAQALLLQLA
ncbi:MAG: LbtU family siderophore porin, partial [Candidatus Thiodiazotropha sp. (ex Notomyrtea botanica)]|nr:LbtU family siderophore porin [Candidatus Thiodiazotropha sp. (ex Notomyrtea botanica)]